MFPPENIAQFASVYLGGASPDDPRASPLYAALHGLPPVLLHVSSHELLLDDATRVHASIVQAGGLSTLELFDDVLHCWQTLDGLVPESGESLRQAAAFIRRHTATSAMLR